MAKARVEELFGGKIRFNILESLAEAKQPMTAYQIAISKGLDPAATYRYVREFADLGIVEYVTTGNQTVYQLTNSVGNTLATFLRSVKGKEQKPMPVDLEVWTSPEMQAERTSKIVGLSNKIRKLPLDIIPENIDVENLLSRRVSGELSALIASSQIAFNELFEQNGDTFVLKDV